MGKMMSCYRQQDADPISSEEAAAKVAHHRPNNTRVNMALIYLAETYLTSGALITIKHVLYLSTGQIKFKDTGKPSQNYTVKVPSFQPSNLQYNIYRIEKKIAFIQLTLVIVNVSITI